MLIILVPESRPPSEQYVIPVSLSVPLDIKACYSETAVLVMEQILEQAEPSKGTEIPKLSVILRDHVLTRPNSYSNSMQICFHFPLH